MIHLFKKRSLGTTSAARYFDIDSDRIVADHMVSASASLIQTLH